jgi:hypothetical protein
MAYEANSVIGFILNSVSILFGIFGAKLETVWLSYSLSFCNFSKLAGIRDSKYVLWF